jgi:hypothetical protein
VREAFEGRMDRASDAPVGNAGAPRGPSSDESPPRAPLEPDSPAVTSRSNAPARRPAGRETAPASATSRSAELENLVASLKGEEAEAERAFKRLWAVRAELIPELIAEVTSSERTGVERIEIFVADKDFVQHGKPFLASDIPGMGAMEVLDGDGGVVRQSYTKKSYSPARNGQGYRVVIDDLRGFPLGVVLRAAMINRFALAVKENRLPAPRYPQGVDHRRHLGAWWRAYYVNMRASLPIVGGGSY